LACISCFSGRQENRRSNPGRIRGLSLLPRVQTRSGIYASTADSTSSGRDFFNSMKTEICQLYINLVRTTEGTNSFSIDQSVNVVESSNQYLL